MGTGQVFVVVGFSRVVMLLHLFGLGRDRLAILNGQTACRMLARFPVFPVQLDQALVALLDHDGRPIIEHMKLKSFDRMRRVMVAFAHAVVVRLEP